MNDEKCGVPTQKGTPCNWPPARCKFHSDSQRTAVRQLLVMEQNDAGGEARIEPDPAVEEIIGSRDLRTAAWHFLGQLLRGQPAAGSPAAAASLIRVLQVLGPSDAQDEETLFEGAVIGSVYQGIPPSTDEGWAVVEKHFPPAVLAEVKNWEPLDGRYAGFGQRRPGPEPAS
jgi:hypothetical protein